MARCRSSEEGLEGVRLRPRLEPPSSHGLSAMTMPGFGLATKASHLKANGTFRVLR